MLIGAHESSAGGLHLAFRRGEADGCEALQVFTSFNMRWARRPIRDDELSLFRSEQARLGWPVLSHAMYLANLASPDACLRDRSVQALHRDLAIAETLGLVGVVLHPGSHMSAGADEGVRNVCAALGELHRRTAGFTARLLLENTAGQGHALGATIAELGRIIGGTAGGERLGVCIDTCHACAAGYDLASAAGYEAFVDELARHVGLDRVGAFHLNDSLRARGSRVDRHAHIGEGELGRAAFARLVSDPRFARTPGVVETPLEPSGATSFARNIRRLKRLRRATGRPPRDPRAKPARGSSRP
jgi:deoxyribonuclease-4